MVVMRNWFKDPDAEGSTYLDDRRMYNPYSRHGFNRSNYENLEDCPEHRLWDPDRKQRFNWADFEPYLQRLSTTDQLIAFYSWHEGWTQWEIADALNWLQSSVRSRLLRIARQLKLLLAPALMPADLSGLGLTDAEKFILLEYSNCLGNYTQVVRRLSDCVIKRNRLQGNRHSLQRRERTEQLCQKYSFTTVRYAVRQAKKKLPQNILQLVTFTDQFITSYRHGGSWSDPLPTRN